MAYRTAKGKKDPTCTGLPLIVCSEEEVDADGDTDNDCDGKVGIDDAVSCKITLTGDVEDIADAWDLECAFGDDECLTTVSSKGLDGEFDVYVFWETHRKGDSDRIPGTDDNQNPNSTDEAVVTRLDDPTP